MFVALSLMFVVRQGATFTLFRYLCEEIITLIINKDKCREILYFDFPNSFHPKFRNSRSSTFLMLFCAKIAAGPPIEPR